MEARDFLSPWADEGRPGDEDRTFKLSVTEGADWDQSFPARAASSFRKYEQGKKEILKSVVPFHDTELQPSSGMYRKG